MTEEVPLVPSATPEPQQPVPSPDALKERRINNAVVFLKNPQVRASPISRRVNFLASKGLSEEEILDGFRRAGQPQQAQEIRDILSGASRTQTAIAAPPHAAPQPAPQVIYQPPPPPPTPGWSWKDYFIAATVAVVGLASAGAVLQAFSPFHLTRKDIKEKRRRSKRRPTSSDEETTEAKPIMDATPTAPPPPSAELTELKSKLSELEEAGKRQATELEKLRGERAELALGQGKLKGQLTKVTHSAEKAQTEKARVEDELTKVSKQLEELRATTASSPPLPAGDSADVAIEEADQ